MEDSLYVNGFCACQELTQMRYMILTRGTLSTSIDYQAINMFLILLCFQYKPMLFSCMFITELMVWYLFCHISITYDIYAGISLGENEISHHSLKCLFLLFSLLLPHFLSRSSVRSYCSLHKVPLPG